MQGLLSWIGTAFGALFVVAVVVAWWEHLVRSKQAHTPPEAAPAHAVSVDVQLDTLATASPGDSAERRATLDGAIGRMAQAGKRPGWVDTRPMVQSGKRSDVPVGTAASPLA